MSYQALARKWRPNSFRELVGQEHVLKALINALDHDRLHHAYLFTGTRGVGKTTIARIMAKCLNCEQGVTSEPCGQCGSCSEIAQGRSVDVLEVDAASRTKVDDTRELLDNVQYAPTSSRFKVYIIDEVHMLTTQSFNALLKTLEEPPAHVKFLLATTDPQKLPATVLSRCLQFNLKNMPAEQVVGHLKDVLDKEMISYELPALWLLGRAAAGSMRDGLSLTDQAIAFGAGTLREADVRSMLGTVDTSFIYQVLEAVIASEPAAVLEVVARMSEHAPDFESAMDELVSLLHRVAIAQAVPDAVDNSWGDAERISQLAAAMTAEDTQLYYQMAINGKRDIPLAADPRGGFEMTLLRMLAFRPALVLDAEAASAVTPVDNKPSTARPAAQEVAQDPVKKPHEARVPPAAQPEESARTASSSQAAPSAQALFAQAPATVRASAASSAAPAEFATARVEPEAKVKPNPNLTSQAQSAANSEARPAPKALDSALPGQIASAAKAKMSLAELRAETWHELLEQLGLSGIVYNVASNCELRSVSDKELLFNLDEDNASLFNSGHTERIRRALNQYFDTELSVLIEPAALQAESPAQRKLRFAAERQAQAVHAIETDPVLQQLIERFDGELDPSSIAPLDN
ncbi:DNA polymerase III subunit gamma/tau [Parahaliea sp. F7430]|uniref:DNA polymerase III subunit gamma/tau n=1 Tax=Sediminihaliea albiluteola TaxID=2758564 RepID=A0A7W2YI33_9GAMM|nr:DNA polymerase III subunit gamma/tau [Sediminihaliea albiluteola]MBA6412086.1 DNA polymerase III subunit gamma/tau [Sediminihaliea albiluteola]